MTSPDNILVSLAIRKSKLRSNIHNVGHCTQAESYHALLFIHISEIDQTILDVIRYEFDNYVNNCFVAIGR